ncbi:MAG: PAS domain S-box protein [Rubrivivax sp.]|nr:PAS domain S-box protein [Rubrivivax sp.]
MPGATDDRWLFERVPAPMVVFLRESLRIVRVNEAFCRFYGCSTAQALQMTLPDLHLPEDREAVARAAVQARGLTDGRQWRHQRADGSVVHVLVQSHDIEFDAQAARLVVVTDVTEQARSRERDRQRLALMERLARGDELGPILEQLVLDHESIFPGSLCSVLLLDDDGVHVRHGAAPSLPGFYNQAIDGLAIGLGQGCCGEAMAVARRVEAADVETHPNWVPFRGLARQAGLRSCWSEPVLGRGGRVLGSFAVYRREPGLPQPEELDHMQFSVQLAATAITHAREHAAVAEHQRLLDTMFAQTTDAIALVDPQTQLFVHFNDAAAACLGYGREAFAKLTPADLRWNADAGLLADRTARVLSGEAMQYETVLRHADGTRRDVDMRLTRVAFGGRTLVSIVWRDITRSKLDRDRLEALVRRRTAELESANARLHREDRRLRAVLLLSRQASGLTEEELLQRGLGEILQLDDSPCGELRAADAAGGELLPRARVGDAPAQLSVQLREGQAVVLELGVAGKAGGYGDTDRRELELLAADLWGIVQRRRTEIQLGRAKLHADAASQAKSAFLANMSHEIRTPMNAIVGFAHLMRRDPLSQRQRDHLGKITDASQHLLQVINDILDFSKIEAHKIALDLADFDLEASLDRVLSMQADAARAKGLPIERRVDPGCPPRLRGDRLRIEQVLINLLSNAVKFTPRGKVTVQVSAQPDGPGRTLLRLEVVDTGVGLSEAQARHVFEAFEQADASTTRRFGGTGLGLAISKGLVQLMQGRIGVHSRLGEGSRFWVELPLAVAPAGSAAGVPAAASVAAAATALDGEGVLVVEDNPVNQEVTASLVAALGARVDIAGSGEEALRRFDPARHRLVLMDMQMPGMDGLQATAAIRARPGGERVPIIALTANAFAEDRARCIAAGMNHYLSKPVDPRALERCLLHWLRPATAAAAPAAPAPVAAGHEAAGLEAVPGLEPGPPLARLRGAWPLYLRMLRMFAEHHQGDVQRLAGLAAADDVPGLRAVAHALAGAASTVGAVEVGRLAHALLAQVRRDPAQPPPRDEVLLLASELDRLCRALAPVLQQREAPAAGPASAPARRAQARELLAQLQPLLAAHDTSALALYERNEPLLLDALGPQAREVGQHLRAFSFQAAHRDVERALAQLQA